MLALSNRYTATPALTGDSPAVDSIRKKRQQFHDIAHSPSEAATVPAITAHEIPPGHPPFTPRQVVLFSGHMIDSPARRIPRFPAKREAIAATEIGAALDRLHVGSHDLALAQAACGGDLLFLEACQARGLRLQVLLPFEEVEFIKRSVIAAADGDTWHQRYFAVTRSLGDDLRIMPDELGPSPSPHGHREDDNFAHCNLWLLHTALAWGADKLRFLCLWDGSSDGPGGTAQMYDQVRRYTNRICWIDTRTLW
ncbi:MAG TPA: hypothetical protein PLS67_11375 [Accumulibacter sp.]|jgi:hypothetical protein|nr:hypothetical protein [Accumulibacter sp.]HQC81097.1 hypothetical protein [Accumulibacter sp.]